MFFFECCDGKFIVYTDKPIGMGRDKFENEDLILTERIINYMFNAHS